MVLLHSRSLRSMKALSVGLVSSAVTRAVAALSL